MYKLFEKTKFSTFSRLIASFIILSFSFNLVILPSKTNAQSVAQLPAPGMMISTTSSFVPPIIRGMTIYPKNPFQFDFIVDSGDDQLQGEVLKEETNRLIKYFLAALTVPAKEMWVNLSPYEKNRVIAKGLGQTEMGRDLLAQDYILKQLTASLMFPENELGKEFWDRVYAKAQEQYGTSKIPMNTFNKIWIVPDKATVHVNGSSVFVAESHLKVMLEEDYLALESNVGSAEHGLGEMTQDDIEIISGVSSEIVREILIPEIEKEVNNGEHFINLRQIYHSMILATWYKKNLKQSLLSQVYIDQSKSQGIAQEDTKENQKIYDQYVEAFKKGVFNFIGESYDAATQQVIPRKYFSGGVDLASLPVDEEGLAFNFEELQSRPLNTVSVRLDRLGTDKASLSNEVLEIQKGFFPSLAAEEQPGFQLIKKAAVEMPERILQGMAQTVTDDINGERVRANQVFSEQLEQYGGQFTEDYDKNLEIVKWINNQEKESSKFKEGFEKLTGEILSDLNIIKITFASITGLHMSATDGIRTSFYQKWLLDVDENKNAAGYDLQSAERLVEQGVSVPGIMVFYDDWQEPKDSPERLISRHLRGEAADIIFMGPNEYGPWKAHRWAGSRDARLEKEDSDSFLKDDQSFSSKQEEFVFSILARFFGFGVEDYLNTGHVHVERGFRPEGVDGNFFPNGSQWVSRGEVKSFVDARVQSVGEEVLEGEVLDFGFSEEDSNFFLSMAAQELIKQADQNMFEMMLTQALESLQERDIVAEDNVDLITMENSVKALESGEIIVDGRTLSSFVDVDSFLSSNENRARDVFEGIVRTIVSLNDSVDEGTDKAMLDPVGGIDLNEELLDLQTQGQGVNFDIPSNLESLESISIEGLTPVIFQIIPTTNLNLLLGSSQENMHETT